PDALPLSRHARLGPQTRGVEERPREPAPSAVALLERPIRRLANAAKVRSHRFGPCPHHDALAAAPIAMLAARWRALRHSSCGLHRASGRTQLVQVDSRHVPSATIRQRLCARARVWTALPNSSRYRGPPRRRLAA